MERFSMAEGACDIAGRSACVRIISEQEGYATGFSPDVLCSVSLSIMHGSATSPCYSVDTDTRDA
jgi:hypothetical protein